ncbi:MAG TPA: shikimate kinase, partial [Salinivirgaceae bacterium]|nr:shikimate kinase [Salinivirgaceae bacterium]HQA76577.1 shikimate kinase [Salinivirgaceae bacterium]
LARKMRWSFVDTDNIIEKELGITVQEVFDQLGEEWFREYEQKVLTKTTSFQNTIIATGGGTPCFYNNMDTIINNGLCIYLRMPPKEIVSRISQSQKIRPLVYNLTGIKLEKYVEKTLVERETVYLKAHLIADALNPNLIHTLEQQIKRYFGTIK